MPRRCLPLELLRLTSISLVVSTLYVGALQGATAQFLDLPESVTFEPGNVALRAGETAQFQVTGTSEIRPMLLEMRVPSDLIIGDESSCSASAFVLPPDDASILIPDGNGGFQVPPSRGNEQARPDQLDCTGTWEYLPAEEQTRLLANTSVATQEALFYDLTINFQVKVPSTAVPGTVYSIVAPLSGLYGATIEALVEVLDQSGKRARPIPTPTSASALPTLTPASVSPAGGSSVEDLTLSPQMTFARPGETVQLTLAYPRLQGVQSIAFLVSADRMFVWNVPRALIDEAGDSACSEGSVGDIVPPSERATDLSIEYDFPPVQLEFVIGDDVRPGDKLEACVEVVGFSGSQELFHWNASATVTVTTQ